MRHPMVGQLHFRWDTCAGCGAEFRVPGVMVGEEFRALITRWEKCPRCEGELVPTTGTVERATEEEHLPANRRVPKKTNREPEPALYRPPKV